MSPTINESNFKIIQKPTNQQAFELNREIEALLDEKGTDSNEYSTAAKLFISQYTGYGGLQDFDADSGLLYEYYTPDEVIKKMWGLALLHGFTGGYVLEPSAGIGDFLKYAPSKKFLKSDIYFEAIEIQKYSSMILKILYPQAKVLHQAFEQLFINTERRESVKGNVNEVFDLVIGNPPYGGITGTGGGKYFNMGEKEYSLARSYDEYFILRGLDVLKAGGLLIYIVGAATAVGGKTFLQKPSSPIKEKIDAISTLIDAYRLPNGIFDRTDVLSDIIVLRKK